MGGLFEKVKKLYDKYKYDFYTIYSEEDNEYVGLCKQFKSLSYLDEDENKALDGIKELVEEILVEEAENKIMFNLTDKDYKKINEWREKHDKKCKLYMNDGAIGGRISYIFTPTSLGVICTVECACKSEDSKIDLTDYENW